MSGYGLGVDLGTTHTAAAVLVGGRVELVRLGNRRPEIPSLVFVTESAVLVGDAAERRGAAEPERLAREFKRRLGDPVPLLVGGSPYPAHALIAKLLRRVYDIVRSQYDEPPRAVTVTHPANWGPFKRELLEQAIRIADVDNVVFLPRPEAAAIHYATTERARPGETVAVYDLGGGTFDAAVLRRTATGFELLGRSEGIEQLGGIDFDEAVFAHVLATIGDSAQVLDPDDELLTTALTRLRRDCTEAKEALSFDTEVMIPVALPGLHTRVRLNRSEFEAMIEPALTETVAATARALRAAGVSPSDLRSVVLAGGSSRIPLVSQLLDAEFGRPVTLDPHPEHSVAMGAAATTGPLALGTTPARPVFVPSPPPTRFAAPAPAASTPSARGEAAPRPTSAPPVSPPPADGAPAWPPVPPTWRGAATPSSGAPSGAGTGPRAPRTGAAMAGDAAARGATGSPVHVNRAAAPARPTSGAAGPAPVEHFPQGTARVRPAATPAPGSPRELPPALATLGRLLGGLRGRRLWLVASLVGVILIAVPVAVLAWPRDNQPADNTTGGSTGGTTGSTSAPAPAVPGKPAHVWSYDVGSPASGRPAVAGDAVYVGDQGGKVHAIDRATGEDRWRYGAGAPVNASPQVRDGVVYIASRDGMLHAIGAADGVRRWRVRAGSGSTSSPVVTGDTIYVGGTDGLSAFQLSGQQRWQFRDGGAITTTPAVSGDTVFASGGNGRVYAVSAGSGSRRWSASIGDGLSAPVAAGGLLYVGSAGRLVHALDGGSGRVRWTFPATGGVTTAPLADAGTVYFGASDGLVYAVNAADGSLRWRYTIEGGQAVSASPSLADRVLYVGSGAGMLYALEAATGAPLWPFTTEGAVAGTALADKVLYVAAGNRVYALQVTTV
ncbi:PQQ-binding-like beta-propeller repeat protein [Micromonospora sp. CPCC 205371]|nr:PQQ-binding-like beta-propeller repeat protein [Micromonospora sp. CPCC 205371]